MKRTKRLTKRERKAQEAAVPSGHEHSGAHIHCVACGRHLDQSEFTSTPVKASFLRCQHGTRYASCKPCVKRAMELIATHDRTGQDVQAAQIWH
jgi:hypothetical protein